jgi:sulfur carrier protein
VTKPELVSVQLNSSFVKRDAYEQTVIKENDEVDFLFFMGGGSLTNWNN